jgi:hypothetical protein
MACRFNGVENETLDATWHPGRPTGTGRAERGNRRHDEDLARRQLVLVVPRDASRHAPGASRRECFFKPFQPLF